MKRIVTLLLCGLFTFMSVPLQAVSAGTDKEDVRVEHLLLPQKLSKKTPINAVNVSDSEIHIMPFNTLELTFAQAFNSKYASVGQEIAFMLSDGLRTVEGTEILPKGTKLVAEITNIEKPKAFNRSGKIYLDFKYLELPTGEQQDVEAKIFNKKDFLSRGKMNALGKGLGSTLGGMAIGTGAGCGIGIAAGAVIVGGFAIGMPVGFAVGAAAGLLTPGLYYKAKAGDKVYIQLTDNLYINR